MKIVKKGWGQERIWADTDRYCGKFLDFDTGAKFSMHFHADKDETWYVLSGAFKIIVLNTEDASEQVIDFTVGDVWRNRPLVPHQIICIDQGTIIEVSSPDSTTDNYRVRPGDSQQ